MCDRLRKVHMKSALEALWRYLSGQMNFLAHMI